MAAEETQRTFDVTQQLRLSGDITPATITADQNNYTPTGLDTAAVLRLASDANNRTLTGLAGGDDGRVLVLVNVGTTTIILSNQNAASTAANRFSIGADVELGGSEAKAVIYDTTLSRWVSLDNALADGSVSARRILANAVDNFKLRDSGALSVIGRSANTTGDPADISASAASGAVLRESGSTVGFGTIATAGIADDAVTYAKIQNVAGFSVVGKASTGAGDAADITAADETVLGRTAAGNVAFAQVATGQIANNAVTDAKIRQGGARTVIGRSANTTGNVADIAGSTAGFALTDDGATVAFRAVDTLPEDVNLPGDISHTLGAGNNNDNAPTGLATASTVRYTPNAATSTITGLTGGADGRILLLHNIDTAVNIFISNQDAASTAANRFITPNGVLYTLAPGCCAFVQYDSTSSRWRVISEMPGLLPQYFVLSGDITPTTLAASTNDYAPTGLSNSARIRLAASVAVNLTGLTGGADGRVITIHNVGTFTITLTNQDAASAAANRFLFTANYPLAPDMSITICYDATTSRWRFFDGVSSVAGILGPATITSNLTTASGQDIRIENGKEKTLTDAATVVGIDNAVNNAFRLTLGGNRTMDIPSNARTSNKITFTLQQATGPFTLAWTTGAAGYAFANAASPSVGGVKQADFDTLLAATPSGSIMQVGFQFDSGINRWVCNSLAGYWL